MQYIFSIPLADPQSITCAECGGSENEGDCGALHEYCVVTTPFTLLKPTIPTLQTVRFETVCTACANAIFSDMVKEVKKHSTPTVPKTEIKHERRKVKRYFASALGLSDGRSTVNWPVTIDINGERAIRRTSIFMWTGDPKSEEGMVYDSYKNVYFIFQDDYPNRHWESK